MRIVFIGTAEIGAPSLRSLAGLREHQVVGVVTQPDRPVGRRQELAPPPIKKLALHLGLPVFQPEKIRAPDALAAIRAWSPELIIVVAYGQILPKELLAMPRHGCVNVHASLLPRWRGAAPIQAALLAGDAETGVTTMLMDEGLDTGPMLLRGALPVAHDDNAGTLHDKLAALGAELLLRTITGIVEGTLSSRPQPSAGATYAPKIRKDDGLVDWSLPAPQLLNRLRAFTPWPGLFTFVADERGRRLLKIWSAGVEPGRCEAGVVACADKQGIAVGAGDGLFVIRELQVEGARRMSADEFLRGHALNAGTKFG
jgi:methionyl-tRNA formyltransferase